MDRKHASSSEQPGNQQLQRHPGPSAVDKWNAKIAMPARRPADTKENSKAATPMAAARAVATAPIVFAVTHPQFMKRYALPLALTTLSKPLLSLFPLGPLGPVLAFVAVACGRFRLRKSFMGGGYALLHAVGMAGLKGQALSLLGLVGLEATGSQTLRDTAVKAIIESNVGVRAQVVGLAIAALSSTTGTFGALGSMLGARSMSLLFKELRAFATFHGLKWAATNLQEMWRAFCASSDVLKASFLSHVLGRKKGRQGVKVDDEMRMQWARATLEKVAARIPQLPVEAMAPELAVILKAWDQEKEPDEAGREALEEWIEVDGNDKNLWASIAYDKHEEMSSSTANVAAYVDRPTFEDFGYRRSRAENARFLEQIARETLEKSGMSKEQIRAALDEMGLRSRPWEMEVEEPDSQDEDDDDGIEVIDLGDL